MYILVLSFGQFIYKLSLIDRADRWVDHMSRPMKRQMCSIPFSKSPIPQGIGAKLIKEECSDKNCFTVNVGLYFLRYAIVFILKKYSCVY